MTNYFTTIIIGLISGSLANVVTQFLPMYLQQSWKKAAQEYLSLPSDPHQPLAIGRLFYTWENQTSWKIIILPLLNTIMCLMAIFQYGWTIHAWSGFVFAFFLLTLMSIDIKTHLLPDELTLPLMWLGLLFHCFTQTIPLEDTILGATAAYLFLRSIYHLFKWFSGKEGMGFGDFKMAAALGAFLGWQALFPVLMMAACMGLIVAVVTQKNQSQHIAFGPFLGIGAWFYWWQATMIERIIG